MDNDTRLAASAHTSGPLLPSWEDCDCFCIQDYAGAQGVACGWRGRFQTVATAVQGTAARCPWCGRASLLRLPPTSPAASEVP